jgi:hypothetical protein
MGRFFKYLHRSGRYEGSYTWFEAVIVRDFIEHAATPGPSDEIELIRQALNRRGSEGDNNSAECEVVTVETPDDNNSDIWQIQRNERSAGEFQLHTVVWTEEEEAVDESVLMNERGRGLGRGFVRSLMKDDRIAVMARAQVSICLYLIYTDSCFLFFLNSILDGSIT